MIGLLKLGRRARGAGAGGALASSIAVVAIAAMGLGGLAAAAAAGLVTPRAYASLLPSARRLEGISSAAPVELTPEEMALRIVGCAVLLLGSALCSGLTLGVLSLDSSQLEILQSAGGPRERVWAERILHVRRDGNLLLCTLLWANVSAGNG